MPRYKEDPPAVRVYTVCDESRSILSFLTIETVEAKIYLATNTTKNEIELLVDRYLIVRNVPALGCGDDLLKLFANYGDVEECKPMDAEDCEQFTDVYWIKFRLISNARFAKRKLDEFVFLGNRLLVSYAPQFESLDDTKDKLEGRRKEILARLNSQRSKGHPVHHVLSSNEAPSLPASSLHIPDQINNRLRDVGDAEFRSHSNNARITRVSSDKVWNTF
ncbi:hypothetical protein Gotur_024182 [Gossypium turneri]